MDPPIIPAVELAHGAGLWAKELSLTPSEPGDRVIWSWKPLIFLQNPLSSQCNFIGILARIRPCRLWDTVSRNSDGVRRNSWAQSPAPWASWTDGMIGRSIGSFSEKWNPTVFFLYKILQKGYELSVALLKCNTMCSGWRQYNISPFWNAKNRCFHMFSAYFLAPARLIYFVYELQAL